MIKNIRISGIFRHLIALWIALATIFSSGCGVSAASLFRTASQETAYDLTLAEITDPSVHGVPATRRREYTRDELLNAKTDALRRLEKNGVEEAFKRASQKMEQIAMERLLQANPELDSQTVTTPQLREAITYLDLSLCYEAPIMERSWYDYALSTANTGVSYAKKCISGYMFVVCCDDQPLMLLRVKYRDNGSFVCQYQDLPNQYCSMYQSAKEQFFSEKDLPILLTDPNMHQAIAFLTSGKHNGIVLVQNYISSSSKDEVLEVRFEDFQSAAINWNRDTMSMLVAADGSIRSDVILSYNNLESYVRSTLRLANKERLMQGTCIAASMMVVMVMVVLNVYRAKVRFLDADDPRRQFKNFFRLIFRRKA